MSAGLSVSLAILVAVLRVECADTIQVPKRPKYLDVIVRSSSDVEVSWEVPGSTPQKSTVYELRWRKREAKDESSKRIFGANGTTFVRGLDAFTAYAFRIRRGHSSNGTLTWGRFTNVTWGRTAEGVPTAPPANVTAYNTSSISIMVRWDQVPKEHRNGHMLGYKVCYQRADKNDSLLFCTAVYTSGLEVGGLTYFKPYLVTVLAFTNEGEGPPCKPVIVWTDEYVPVRSPKILSIKSRTTSVKLRWAPIPQQYVNGILRGYYVTIMAKFYRERRVIQVNASTLHVNVPGLRRNTTYRVQLRGFTRVRGVLRSGRSGHIHNFTTKFGCSAPQNVQAFSPCSSCINIQWDPVPPADPAKPVQGYHVTYVAESKTRQTKITDSQETNLRINNLQKFTAYSLIVAAVTSEGLGKASQRITVVTEEDVPSRPPESVALQSSGPNSIKITWSPVPKEYRHGLLLRYHVYYRKQDTRTKRSVNPAGAIHALSFNASALSVEITGLSAFSWYEVWLSASTSKGNGPSTTSKRIQTMEDVPGQAPRGVQAHSEDSTTIDVKWQPIPVESVPGILKGYQVTYRKTNAVDLDQKNVITLDPSYHRVIIKGVEPLTQYEVWVAGFTRRGPGPGSVKVHITTPGNAPERPQKVNVNILGPRSVKVTWQAPSSWKGHVTRFMVQWVNHEKTVRSSQEGHKIVKAGKPYWRKTVIGGLIPYTSYSFSVKEETQGGNWGEFSEPRDVMMPEDVPSEPRNFSLLKKEGVRLILAWKAPLSPNGVIQKYLIHFTADSGAAKTNTFVNGVQAKLLTYTFDLPDVASKYTITVQAFNSLPGKMSAPLNVEHSPVDAFDSKKSSDFKSKLVWLICGMTVIVLLLVAVMAIVLVRRSMRRSRIKRGAKQQKCRVSIVSKSAKPRRSIPITALKEHCERFHANNDALFIDEFRSLDLLTWKSACTASQLPMNRPKNRFYDINANDLTRVVLNTFMDIPGSDYINANYIDSYSSPARFIATQGPLRDTVADFWRMVWEKNCPVIVMLENFKNKSGHHLCEQYWPSVGSAEYGNLAVSLLATTEMSEWTLREFIVWSTDPECMDKRELKHLQYKTWPDQGIPPNTGAFLAFHHKFRTLLPSEPCGPIVVHCSTGVGRTGSFIAIESLFEQMEAEGLVDVYGFVSQMRRQRSFMVQTKEQYCFIYDVLRDASLCGVTEVASQELGTSLLCARVEEPEVFTRRATEFECLQTFNVDPSLSSNAQQRINLVKNRCPDVLPYDRNRVRLPAIPDVPSSDYINASYIDGYNIGKMFIATQNPLANTTNDFWKMVWDQRSSVVIMLNHIKEPELDESVQYWPDQTAGCARYGRVQVTKFDEEVLEGLTQRMFKVRYHGSEDSLVLYHFQFHDWTNSQSLVYLHEQVQKVKPKENRGPVIVHCSDGASLTGVFLALCVSIERLECQDTIDMYQTVRWLRAQRPGLVQTADQYNFCYEALRSYLTWRIRGATNDYCEELHV